MKNIWTTLVVAMFLLTSCGQISTNTGTIIEEKVVEKTAEEITQEQKQLELLERKQKQFYQTFITRGDYYTVQNEKELAYKTYKIADIKLWGKDKELAKKIATLLYELGKYKEAVPYFERMDEYSSKDALSYIYSLYNSSHSDFESKLYSLNIPTEEVEYLLFNNTCLKDYTECLDYTLSYSGENQNILSLKTVLENFSALKDNGTLYRDALVAQEFYHQKNYPLAIQIGNQILEEAPKYHSVLQILGLSHFELQEYKKAQEALLTYLKLDPKNTNISYTLGLSYFYLKDYSTASIYLNKVVINGDSLFQTDAERFLAYTYYSTKSYENMFLVLNNLLENSEATANDFIRSTYAAIEKEKTDLAETWSKKGVERFEGNDMIQAIRGMVLLDQGNIIAAESHLEKSLEINNKNPLALLEMAISKYSAGNTSVAKLYLRKVMKIDADGVFGTEAKKLLTEIQNPTNTQEDESGTIS